MKVIQVHTALELGQVKQLFREYFEFLARDVGLDISYQGIEDELAALPGGFAAPEGRLMMAVISGQPAGCAALRLIDERVCELKRMYVRPQFRGLGVGKALAQELIQEAQRIGYVRMRLDTAGFLTAAVGLYESLGFERIPQYGDLPADVRRIAIFMELVLG